MPNLSTLVSRSLCSSHQTRIIQDVTLWLKFEVQMRSCLKTEDQRHNTAVVFIRHYSSPMPFSLLRSTAPAASKSAASTTELRATDQDRRKQVAERLLEKASQRATEAKTGLKAAAESTRREADLAATAAAAAAAAANTGAEHKPLQEAVASR